MPKIFLEVEVDEMDPRQSLEPGAPVTLNELNDAAGCDLGAKIVPEPKPCRYVAVLTQGGGCDYTIGCGVKVKSLRATTIEAAMAEVERIIENDYGGGPECRIDGVTVYETTGKSVADIQAIYAQLAAKAKAAQEAEDEDEERAELARLSKKYGRP